MQYTKRCSTWYNCSKTYLSPKDSWWLISMEPHFQSLIYTHPNRLLQPQSWALQKTKPIGSKGGWVNNKWMDSPSFKSCPKQQMLSHYKPPRSKGCVVVTTWLNFGWPWEIRSRSNYYLKFSIGRISVTIKDTALWLITMRDDITVHYVIYLRWPWENEVKVKLTFKMFNLSYFSNR